METEKRQAELPMLSKKFGSDYFERLYRGSGDRNSPGKLDIYLKLIKRSLLGVRQGDSLLDIGCGYGRFLKLAENEFVTYGIDPSEFAINEAGKYAVNTKFEVAAILSYRPKKLFDVITCFDVLEHVPDVEKSVLKIKSWLKPKGIFFCVIPVYDGPLGWIAGKLDRDETHINKWSRDRWLGLFAKHFKVITIWGAVRYSFGAFGYFHLAIPWLARWGQAILAVMRK
ncbi:MAG: class I SAM-dependent methyltransferase [Parcubacteria group bacterium]|nr:class I SAM-dependent methyltransferase [Parcubacteria group bacterium]